jgi:pimeloyl-ACP methyl ester carboxylesterase
MVIANALQTSGGGVIIKELTWETDQGVTMTANLFVPKSATVENPAPAIVASHGLYNNKEMQDANAIELARRGFVVAAIDQPNHGDSELGGTNGAPVTSNPGVYQGVLMLSRIPYVDVTRIGVTGHSMGGGSCNNAVAMDNANGTNLIASVLLNSADATYINRETGEYVNIYGSRDVGIVACKYDEFFHTMTNENNEIVYAAPYFLERDTAKSFLNFGADPQSAETRVEDTLYRETIDGKDAVRVIYQVDIIHPWSHFSYRSTVATIDYFNETLGAPNPIASSNQIWFLKEVFNFVGLIGLVMFIINFTILLVFTPFFETLRAKAVVQPAPVDRQGKLWFWCSLAAGALFAMITYLPIVSNGVAASFVPQKPTFGVGLWAMACGLFAVLSMVVSYIVYGKKNGFSLAERGVTISLAKLGKTALLAVIVVCVAYSCVFFADYFFQTDFRFWVLAIKSFEPGLIATSLFPYMVLFLIYYVASSVANNCFNYNQIGGKRNWVNTLTVSLFAGAPAIIMLPMQYVTYAATNQMLWHRTLTSLGNPPMYVLWLFPMLLILPGAALISRAIYKVTNNPYIAGIISGIIVTLLSCTNTQTLLL